MEKFSGIQIIITAILSSGLGAGIITMLTKKVWSPESKNELARIGNEFAQTLLEDARAEREELRATIQELQDSILSKTDALIRLQRIADNKDDVIRDLEERQFVVAKKIQLGEIVTFYDIFGPRTPPEFLTGLTQITKGTIDG